MMSTVSGNNCDEAPPRRSFWKKGIKSVPGSASRLAKNTGSSSGGMAQEKFEEFAKQTKDAWDDGDDDLLLEAYNVRISKRDVQSAAAQVLQSHSQQQAIASATKPATTTPVSKFPASSSSSSSTAAHRSYDFHSTKPTPVRGATSVPNAQLHPDLGHRLSGPGLGIRLDSSVRQFSANLPPQQQIALKDRERIKAEKFASLFIAANVVLDELRKMSWSGIPPQHRPLAWKLLSGYVSPNSERREAMLERKRQEYHNFVDQYYSTRHQDIHQDTYRQIHIDVPRMSPLIPLFQQELVQQIFERILYIWSIRHPASGYVQGINDLVTPFFVVFLSEYIKDGSDVDTCQLTSLAATEVQELEADCFWCFSKLLDGIQDNYTFAQPGIQTRVNSLKDLISRIDNNLHRHLEQLNIEYLQFAFRWMNNLLMREMPLHRVIRLWDTYLSEPDGFASFHLYVCASFLTRFSADLQNEHDFHGLMILLQNLPTEHWTDEEVELVLAEAYKLKFMFADAPKHLKDNNTVVTTTASTSATNSSSHRT